MTLESTLLIFRTVLSAILTVSLVTASVFTPPGASAALRRSGAGSWPAGDPGAKDLGINFKSLPLRFEQNVGQTDAAVRFIARNRDGIAFLAPGETVLSIQRRSSPSESNVAARSLKAMRKTVETKSAVVRLRTVR